MNLLIGAARLICIVTFWLTLFAMLIVVLVVVNPL